MKKISIAIAYLLFVVVLVYQLSSNEVHQEEFNHHVVDGVCKVVTDNKDSVVVIWFNNEPYTLDTNVITNL